MPPRSRRQRVVLVVGLLSVLAVIMGSTLVPYVGRIAGSDLSQTEAGPEATPESMAPVASTPGTSTTPGTTTTPGAVRTEAERPIRPIPDVRPHGFIDPPPGRDLQRYLDQQIDWSDCRKGLQCAVVRAPLDYADPDGQAITLALAKRPATEEPRAGALFVNPGGPGASGVDFVARFDATGLERFDLIGWDPRGTGASTPVVCINGKPMDAYTSIDISPDNDAEEAALEQTQLDFGRGCLDRSGALLAHISTVETVHDLDLLRALLGEDRLNYLGFSYGTKIGAYYAEFYPRQVGRVVLDGAVNLSDDSDISQLDGFERALGNFASWCAEQDCRLGDTKAAVLDSIRRLLRDLDSKPLDGGRAELTQQLGLTGILAVLYENETGWRYLERALEMAIEDRDGRYLLYFADVYNERGKNGRYGQLQFSFEAIRCLDSRENSVAKARQEADTEAKRAPILGPFAGADLSCPLWPVASAPKPPKITGTGAAPILVIGTTGDPATPYEYAERMADQLESGHLLTLRGEGHLAYNQSSCIRRHVQSYLVTGELPETGARC
ncbi:MAG: alpha/beta hydrolase [Microlunatus sp.]